VGTGVIGEVVETGVNVADVVSGGRVIAGAAAVAVTGAMVIVAGMAAAGTGGMTGVTAGAGDLRRAGADAGAMNGPSMKWCRPRKM
jgi:hypothetical protein